jgi:putative transposase
MRANNRAQNSHLSARRKERKQQKFKSQGSTQSFLSTHAALYNTFNIQPHLVRRPTVRRFRAEVLRHWRRPRDRSCGPGAFADLGPLARQGLELKR